MSIKKSIIGGVFWTTIESMVNRGFGLIIQFFLARLLFPEDYGLVGMAAVFISFLEIFNDLGMNAALVQKKAEKLTPAHFDTVFWTGVVWAFFLFLLMGLIGAPLAAQFYNQEKLSLIIPALSISILLSPVNLVHKAQLTKAMAFKKLAIINNTSNIIAGITAVALAFLGFGVWALVFYSIARVIVSMPLFFRATKWVPKFRWERGIFNEVFGFGAYTTGTAFFNKLTGNIDYLLVGKLLGASALGFYSFAFICTNAFRDQLVNIVNKVLYPVYASLQDDTRRMLDLFLKIISINNFIVYPIMLGLILFGEFMIPIFFGDKWNDSIPIIKILCIAVLIQMLNNSHTKLFRAAGEVRLEFNLQILKSIAYFVPLISLGVYLYDAIGAAIGFTVATFLAVSTSFYFMNKKFGLKIRETFHAVKVPVIMLFVCWPTTEFLKSFLDWRLCLVYYFCAFTFIYLILGKSQIDMMWNIVRRPRAIFKK